MARSRKALTKPRVKAFLERHFLLRLHMFFILSATIASGLLATKMLLAIGVRSFPLRYALAVSAAYLLFLALIRMWLFYVRMARGGVDFTPDGLDFSPGNVSTADFSGGGGNFGGGGASGSWGQAPAKSRLFDGIELDGEGLLVVILFVALVLSLLLVSIYVIYTAPVMLSEVAFEALLAAALAKRAKKIQRPGWIGVVWRATVWPFVVVLVLTIALGWVAQKRCPEAKKLRDVFSGCKRTRPVRP